MAEQKTKPTKVSVKKFLAGIENETRRKDAEELLKIMKQITRQEPKMWGPSIIGFDSYHYKYESGHEGDCFITGFSPRKQNLSLYVMPGFARYETLMGKLGKHKTGKSCLYINKLADIDLAVLKELIKQSYQYMKKKYK